MFPKPPKKEKRVYMGVSPSVRRAVWERCNGICEGPAVRENGEVILQHTCQERATQLSHLRGKGMGGSRELDTESNTAYLCLRHHDLLDRRAFED